MPALVQNLIKLGVLRTPRYIEAFKAVDRRDFVIPDPLVDPYGDWPLSIGFEQTISQPYTVSFMIELLCPQSGENILDVGSGSGWTTALLGHIVGETGSVHGVEIIPELVEFGRKNLEKYNFPHVEITKSGKELGFPAKGPYDRILVSASAYEVPQELVDQLKPEGIMVIPIGTVMTRIRKAPDGILHTETYPGFMFVPLVDS